jgi:RHS repeat-associated protein
MVVRSLPAGDNPWGNARATTGGSLPTDYTFTGQRLDSGTTLLDYGAKWYDPSFFAGR